MAWGTTNTTDVCSRRSSEWAAFAWNDEHEFKIKDDQHKIKEQYESYKWWVDGRNKWMGRWRDVDLDRGRRIGGRPAGRFDQKGLQQIIVWSRTSSDGVAACHGRSRVAGRVLEIR